MEIGDLIKRRYPYSDGYQNVAYVIGFDDEGDIEIEYLNPDPNRGLSKDLDYKSSWELLK
jgi:hypothetical protein